MKTFLTCMMCFVLLGLRCQTVQNFVISSGGTHAQSGNVHISMTAGEPVIETFSSTQVHLTQGFHQYYIITTLIEDSPAFSDILLYPNPVEQYLTIHIPNALNLRPVVVLFDMNGKLLLYQEVNEDNISLDFSPYMAGVYFLEIRNLQNSARKVWKIVKQE